MRYIHIQFNGLPDNIVLNKFSNLFTITYKTSFQYPNLWALRETYRTGLLPQNHNVFGKYFIDNKTANLIPFFINLEHKGLYIYLLENNVSLHSISIFYDYDEEKIFTIRRGSIKKFRCYNIETFKSFIDKEISLLESVGCEFCEIIVDFSYLYFQGNARVDSWIEDLFNKIISFSKDATIIFSSLYTLKKYSSSFNLIEWLTKKDFISFKYKESSHSQKMINTIKNAIGIGSTSYLQKIFKHFVWEKTKAYSLNEGTISINLREREPFGIVNKGIAFNELRDNIIEELKKELPPDISVLPKESLFIGKYFKNAPDIILISNDNTLKIFNDYEPASIINDNGFAISFNGFISLRGDEFNPACGSGGINVEDILPTFLYMRGIVVPGLFDGKVHTNLFKKEHLEKYPPDIYILKNKKEEYSKDLGALKLGITKDDEERIRKEVQKLGYGLKRK
ncbi:MAG: hypothetical protein AB1765_05995 [Candidatus Hydrogenedentota bacterium]